MLEETGLAYEPHVLDFSKGRPEDAGLSGDQSQRQDPAIVDRDGYGGEPTAIFGSGALLIYLAEESGQFLATDPAARMVTLQWPMFQMAGVGPMFGQAGYWTRADTSAPAATKRYRDEADRLLSVLDRRLADAPYLAGAYSIADIATWPWVNAFGFIGLDLGPTPHVARWHATIAERPAVQRGLLVAETPS